MTTAEELHEQLKADPDAFMNHINGIYEKANKQEQARLRLFSAIGLIMNSNSDSAIKADALGYAISCYTADTIIQTCEKLADGNAAGMDVGLGIEVFRLTSMRRSMEYSDKLVNILETLTYDDPEPTA